MRANITGTVGTATAFVASIPLSHINALLQLISFVIGIIVGSLTIYRIFNHSDTRAISEKQDELARKLDILQQHGCSQKFCKRQTEV